MPLHTGPERPPFVVLIFDEVHQNQEYRSGNNWSNVQVFHFNTPLGLRLFRQGDLQRI